MMYGLEMERDNSYKG